MRKAIKVSHIQESWAIDLLERRKITHNEIVPDAGCGTGRVTKIIADTVKKGKVYAVDKDANMISNAKKTSRIFQTQYSSNQVYRILICRKKWN
jgi:trans-aconitate methyltransferase